VTVNLNAAQVRGALDRLDALIASMGEATAAAIGGKKGADLAKKYEELRVLASELYDAHA